jgi:glycosyltransferase involved in cell wall biosynthesis
MSAPRSSTPGRVRLLTVFPQLTATGGVEQHLLQLTRELARREFEIHLRYTEDGELGEELRSFCASVAQEPSVRYTGSPLGDLRRIAPAVWSAVRARPDVIYANNFSELVWAAAVKAVLRVPIVCHLHAFDFAQFARPRPAQALGSQVHRFIVASEFMRSAWTEHGLDADKVETIPYGINLSDYPRGTEEDRRRSRQALGLPLDAYIALYLGRLDAEKGVEVLLEAWRQLAAAPEEARLLLVGSPILHPDPAAYLEQLQDHAPPGCHWLPMRPDVLQPMHAADVLVLPSVWDEPFGRVIIETMATGRPVVASCAGGIPEILNGPFAQFLFRKGDAASLAERLRGLRRWRTDRPELADQCIDHVAESYTLKDTADRMEAVLREAVGPQSSRS